MGKPRISRFTVDLETKQLELDSEVVIFEYDSQIYSCCHRGGGMGFDSEGNLYVTTGDSNSSQSTNGYSGNFQPARCPTGDPQRGSNNHCGNNNISYNDARRTAGNTNDYNGKMLRFNPIDTIPDGAQPTIGVSSTYTLPDARARRTARTSSAAPRATAARPSRRSTRWACATRRACPSTPRPTSRTRRGSAPTPARRRRPRARRRTRTRPRSPQAGNYGWPYCMGNQQAYRDRVADGSLRTTNAAGFVTGGPAASPTQGWYDCKNLVNDSTNNTGLTVLPHTTGTGKDAGTRAAAEPLVQPRQPGQRQRLPDFPRELGADAAPNYGANPDASSART